MNMTRNLKILIIEDDSHKIDDLSRFISELGDQYSYLIKKSVREAVMEVINNDHDIIILDMALPTFNQADKASGGISQPQGGLEIIRTLKSIKKNMDVIIFTQYPDIEIDGKFQSINNSVDILSKRYKCNIIGAIHYKYDDLIWKKKLRETLGVHQ
jgi:CheY-like chemotaxis protein